MCGRFTLTKPPDIITQHFGLAGHGGMDALCMPRYNIAPTQTIFALRHIEGRRELIPARWGLIPAWAKNANAPLINARADTLALKPSFREAFRQRRCLIPADGFYEWQPAGKRKQPWFISLVNQEVFAFAGLWEAWRAPDGTLTPTCAIITTTPNERLASIHDRMPAIIPPAAYDEWLVGDNPAALLAPYPAEAFQLHPVAATVSSPRNDSPECNQAVALTP
ncbi:MAG TPA: SOS response-associated peptidase [Terriglobales bacterium]|nr:SOS response-associated peptidase [Terriglobales bacterium]